MSGYTQNANDITNDTIRRFGPADPDSPTGGRILIPRLYPETGETRTTPEPSTLRAPPGPLPTRSKAPPALDSTKINRAIELIDSIEFSDTYNITLYLASLRGLVLSMWETAADASIFHQDILALLDNAVCSACRDDSLTPDELSAFRESLTDLNQSRLVRANVDVIRHRFLSAGFAPLSFVEESGTVTDDSAH